MRKNLARLTLLFVAVCMCISLAACSDKEPEVSINARVDSFSATYDSTTYHSNVNVSVTVVNNSEETDISGFSYTVRFFDMNNSLLYEETANHSEQMLEAGNSTVITKDYSVPGQVAFATAIPNSAKPIIKEESSDSGCGGSSSDSGCGGSTASVGGGSASGILVIIGIYLAYKYFFADE